MSSIIVTFALIIVLAGSVGVLLGRMVRPPQRDVDKMTIFEMQGSLERSQRENANLKSRAEKLDADLKQKADSLREEEKKNTRLDERVTALTAQVEEYKQTLAVAGGENTAADEKIQALKENIARLTERESRLAQEVADLETRLRATSDARDQEAALARLSAEEAARLAEREAALVKEVASLEAQLSGLDQTVQAQFEKIAERILRHNSADLSDVSQRQLAEVLEPLRKRINEFQGRVEHSYGEEKREIFALKEQIRMLADASRTLGTQADSLSRALKGDVQRLGRWGEVVLDRVLQAAGLAEGREYVRRELYGTHEPVVFIKLPDNRTMTVDTDVPLTAYDQLLAARDEGERADCAGRLVLEVKAHVEDLANRRYPEGFQHATHDGVLMFFPAEGALAAVLAADPDLFGYAWDRRVVPVGPSTLLMTLRTVASVWRHEIQTQNVQEMARLVSALCDKVGDSLADLNTVSEKMHQAMAAHSEALKRLSYGKGNALSIGERIRSLGISSRGMSPTVYLGEESAGVERHEQALPKQESAE